MRRPEGFSMLEVVVSAFLFGAVIIVLMNLYPTSIIGLNRNRARGHGVQLARSWLALYQNDSFSLLPVGLDRPVGPQTVDTVTYTGRLQVFNPPQGNPLFLRLLQVTVTWPSNNTYVEQGWVARVRH